MMERKFTQQGKWVIVLVKCIINLFVYRICFFLIQKTGKLENGKLGYYFAFERHSLQIIPLSSHLQNMMLAGTEWTSGQQWKDSANPSAKNPTILIVLVVKWSSRTGQTTAIKFTPEKALVSPREISRIQTGKVQNKFFK